MIPFPHWPYFCSPPAFRYTCTNTSTSSSSSLLSCVMFEETNITIFHYIFFPFCSDFTSRAHCCGCCKRSTGFVPIFESIDFTANEMFLKITMNCTSCFWCCKSTTNRPLSNFIRTASKKRLPVVESYNLIRNREMKVE